MTTEKFNAAECALDGVNMVEAAAGTGKTYNIQELVLRLLLEKGLAIYEILVVTYTEAATAELKSRIRAILQEALNFQHKIPVPDPARIEKLINHARETGVSKEDITRRLKDALTDFDRSMISTIHGFCQRILSENAFESGVLFNMSINTRPDDILQDIMTDFFRKEFYASDYGKLRSQLQKAANIRPDTFKDIINKCLSHPDLQILPAVKETDTADTVKRIAEIIGANDLPEMPEDGGNTELEEAFADYQNILTRAAVAYVLKKFEKRKKEEHFQTFDDLLTKVRDKSEDPRFVSMVREKLKAAVVDEFQDTDPVQYAIFKNIFGENSVLFMVGDPRQAIYSFRGGDIETYREAEREVPGDRKFFLPVNYRSSTAMVEAVNRIFSFPYHLNSFADKSITFPEIQSGGEVPGYLIDGKEDTSPLKVSWLDINDGDQLKEKAISYCASRIFQMLNSRKIQVPDRKKKGEYNPLVPGDIAIIIRANDDGPLLKRELAKYNIPSVIRKGANIFDSAMAQELETVLKAITEQTNENVLRAMNCGLIGYEAPELIALKQQGILQERIAEVKTSFNILKKEWESRSFIQMFQLMLEIFHSRKKLLAKENGERNLTDLLQLRDILSRESLYNGLSVSGLLHFLKRQRSERLRDKNDEYDTLLETDRAAVTIMTIHSSKGLEFPFVFLPTLYSMSARQQKESLFHKEGRISYDFSDDKTNKALVYAENFQENLRLAYVAITRAKYYCHIFWGEIKYKHSVLDWLFRMKNVEIPEDLSKLQPKVKENTGSEPDFSEVFQENIRPYGLPSGQYRPIGNDIPEPQKKEWQGNIDTSWRITSYSGLTAHSSGSASDFDEKTDDEAIISRKPEGIFAIPGGAQIGLAWHSIFEKLDFRKPDNLQSLTEKYLSESGMLDSQNREERIRLTVEMVRNILAARLPHESFSLGEIGRSQRASEMKFHFGFKNPEGFHLHDVRELLNDFVRERFGDGKWDLPEEFIKGGFMNGSIDLVFCHDGRFFIADWKSNRIGGTKESFSHDGMGKEVFKHLYFLQYLIYSLALFKFLEQKTGAMDKEKYERHFGGVYYFFLRGISPDAPGCGIWYDRPSYELIKDLNHLIG